MTGMNQKQSMAPAQMGNEPIGGRTKLGFEPAPRIVSNHTPVMIMLTAGIWYIKERNTCSKWRKFIYMGYKAISLDKVVM